MNDIDKIKEKIKKLLALSRSPNPNEAASALRMAQELMAEYKIDQTSVNIFDIGEETVSAARHRNVPRYEVRLCNKISDAFGCRLIHYCHGNKCAWHFIGLQHRAQIAAYIGQILLRKLKSARAGYIKSLYRVRPKGRKTRRADDYCLAWVDAVTDKLSAFAGISAEEKKAIMLYKNEKHPDLANLGIIDRAFDNDTDYLNGARAGSGVELQYGVGVHSQSPLLLGA